MKWSELLGKTVTIVYSGWELLLILKMKGLQILIQKDIFVLRNASLKTNLECVTCSLASKDPLCKINLISIHNNCFPSVCPKASSAA